MRRSIRSCFAAVGSAIATAAVGAFGTLYLADRVKIACTNVAEAVIGISATASNSTVALSSLFSSLSGASSVASSALTAATSGLSAAANSTSGILSQLSSAAGQVGPVLSNLNQTIVDLPFHSEILIHLPELPLSSFQAAASSSTIPIMLDTTISVPLTNLISENTAGILASLTTNGEQASQLLSAMGTTVAQTGEQVVPLLSQIGEHLTHAGVAAEQVSELVSEAGSQLSQLSGQIVSLPGMCSGVTLGLGLSFTLMAASVVGLVVYLCVRHGEPTPNTDSDLEDARNFRRLMSM